MPLPPLAPPPDARHNQPLSPGRQAKRGQLRQPIARDGLRCLHLPRPAMSHARAHPALLQALPPRYGQVLLDLLDRLEAGATFTDEGCCCSFSHGALVESVGQWVARAGQALDAA